MRHFFNKIRFSSFTKTILFITLIIWGLLAPFFIICRCSFPHQIEKISILGKLSIFMPKLLKQTEVKPALRTSSAKQYFVDTPGCRMPKLDIMNKDIANYLTEKYDVKCGHEKLMTQADNEAMWIGLNEKELNKYYNVTNVGLLTCYYWSFSRRTDFENKVHNDVKTFKFGERVKVTGHQYVKVNCAYDQQPSIYEFAHIFMTRNPDKAQDVRDDRTGENINVMVYGIDSISRLNFYRQMTETMKLLNQLGAMELQGYSKVEDNTYPNLIPVLTGLNYTELEKKCLPSANSTFDKCPMLWDQFKIKGYKTLFAEDSQWLGLFNYERGGYQHKPTDLYPRNYFMDLENSIASYQNSNAAVCLGQRKTLDVFLDYLRQVTDVYRRESLFAFLWTCAMTHDLFESVRSVDSTIRELVNGMNQTNYLNNTVFVLMSDHGLRFGGFRNTYQGMIEERQPFLFMLAPAWYQALYPRAFANFRANSKRLTTHFDLHETLKDLSNPAFLTDDAIIERSVELQTAPTVPRGISLFLSVPESRTCAMAGIDNHWCTCHEQKKLKKTSTRAQLAAAAMVNHINKLLEKYPQCKKLELNRITDANINYVNKGNLARNLFGSKTSDIVVTLETRPGLATFEGTIRIGQRYVLSLMGPVSRTNKYGKQSWCVSDPIAKLYCYC